MLHRLCKITFYLTDQELPNTKSSQDIEVSRALQSNVTISRITIELVNLFTTSYFS